MYRMVERESLDVFYFLLFFFHESCIRRSWTCTSLCRLVITKAKKRVKSTTINFQNVTYVWPKGASCHVA